MKIKNYSFGPFPASAQWFKLPIIDNYCEVILCKYQARRVRIALATRSMSNAVIVQKEPQ